MSICYHSIMPPKPPAPQHLVGDPGGVPWQLGRGACRRQEVLGGQGLPGLGGPMLCGISTKYLGFQLFIVSKEKCWRWAGCNRHTRVDEADQF